MSLCLLCHSHSQSSSNKHTYQRPILWHSPAHCIHPHLRVRLHLVPRQVEKSVLFNPVCRRIRVVVHCFKRCCVVELPFHVAGELVQALTPRRVALHQACNPCTLNFELVLLDPLVQTLGRVRDPRAHGVYLVPERDKVVG